MLKQLKYMFSLQLVLASFTYGGSQDGLDDFEDPLDELAYENEEGHFHAYLAQEPQIQKGEGVSNAEHSEGRTCHFSLFGEMLYLKPYYQDMPFMIATNSSQYTPGVASANNVRKNSFKTFDLDFDFGFRIGAGYKASWLNMETVASWMRFHGSTSYTTPPAAVFAYTYDVYWNNSFAEPCGAGYIISYDTKIKWDQFDLASQFWMAPVKRLKIAPKVGVRGVLSQINTDIVDIKTAWGCTDQGRLTPPQNNQTNKLREKYNAIGLLGGFDSELDLGWGFHLDTLFNAAVVFGNMKTKNDSYKVVGLDRPNSLPATYFGKTDYYTARPIFDAQLVLAWNKECFKTVGIDLYVGYEVHYMPNYLQMYRLVDTNSEVLRYDLSMQGLTAGAGLSF